MPSGMRTPRMLLLLAALPICGCVMVPVTVEGFDPDCRVVTHHMELQPVQLNAIGRCGDGACAAIVLGVSAASAIVSGSIVVVGNVGYWAEHRASCVAPPGPPSPAQ